MPQHSRAVGLTPLYTHPGPSAQQTTGNSIEPAFAFKFVSEICHVKRRDIRASRASPQPFARCNRGHISDASLHVYCSHPEGNPRANLNFNLPQMPPDSGGDCVEVDLRNYRSLQRRVVHREAHPQPAPISKTSASVGSADFSQDVMLDLQEKNENCGVKKSLGPRTDRAQID